MIGSLAGTHQLKSLLPMDANCKKIRDDNGDCQDGVNQISTDTDTVFSNGFCPECKELHNSEQKSL